MPGTAATLTEDQRRLLEKPNFAHLTTLRPDGSPHATVVWVDLDGDDILVNTAEGRVKTRHLRDDRRVALSVHDEENPYERVCVTGQVVEMTHEGADEHIDALAKKYMGQDRYPGRAPGEQRVILRIRPERVA